MFITTKVREVSMESIPEIRLMDKIIAGGGGLTPEEREYVRQLRQEEREERGMTRDEISSVDAGIPCRGEI